MRRLFIDTTGSGPAAVMADEAGVRACASYLSSRWVQAPIPDRREADT